MPKGEIFMETMKVGFLTLNYEESEKLRVYQLVKNILPTITQLKSQMKRKRDTITIPKYFDLGTLSQEIILRQLQRVVLPCYHPLLKELAKVLFVGLENYDWQTWNKQFLLEYYKEDADPSYFLTHRQNRLIVAYLIKSSPDLMARLTSQNQDYQQLLNESFQYFKERYYIKLEDATTPFQIISAIWGNINYGWVDEEGTIHRDLREFKEKYRIQSLEETITNKRGCCIDTARLATYLLNRQGYATKIRLIRVMKNGETKIHAYTLFCDQGIWYRLDPNFSYQPLREVGTLAEDKNLSFHEEDPGAYISVAEITEDMEKLSYSELIQKTFGSSRKK